MMRVIRNYLLVIARLLMSSLFLWEGSVQLRNSKGAVQYFANVHVPMPETAIWLSVIIHIAGGLAILIGLKTRWAAGLLALLCLGTAFGVHLPVGDASNMLNFYKNLVMTGGFLYVITFGAGPISLDGNGAASAL